MPPAPPRRPLRAPARPRAAPAPRSAPTHRRRAAPGCLRATATTNGAGRAVARWATCHVARVGPFSRPPHPHRDSGHTPPASRPAPLGCSKPACTGAPRARALHGCWTLVGVRNFPAQATCPSPRRPTRSGGSARAPRRRAPTTRTRAPAVRPRPRPSRGAAGRPGSPVAISRHLPRALEELRPLALSSPQTAWPPPRPRTPSA